MKNNLAYIKAFFKEFQNTGTLFPSSKSLCESLTKNLENRTEPLNILEVGSGTGVITKYILNKMIPGDILTLSELNQEFIKILDKNIKKHKNYQTFQNNITIFEGPFQELHLDQSYDLIICSLPFLNFDLNLTTAIFKKFDEVAKPHCKLAYFTFFAAAFASKIILKNEKERLKEIEKFHKSQNLFTVSGKDFILLNIPPAIVLNLKKL